MPRCRRFKLRNPNTIFNRLNNTVPRTQNIQERNGTSTSISHPPDTSVSLPCFHTCCLVASGRAETKRDSLFTINTSPNGRAPHNHQIQPDYAKPGTRDRQIARRRTLGPMAGQQRRMPTTHQSRQSRVAPTPIPNHPPHKKRYEHGFPPRSPPNADSVPPPPMCRNAKHASPTAPASVSDDWHGVVHSHSCKAVVTVAVSLCFSSVALASVSSGIHVGTCGELRAALEANGGEGDVAVDVGVQCDVVNQTREGNPGGYPWALPMRITRDLTVCGDLSEDALGSVQWGDSHKAVIVAGGASITFRDMILYQTEMGVGGLDVPFVRSESGSEVLIDRVGVVTAVCPNHIGAFASVGQWSPRPASVPGEQKFRTMGDYTLLVEDFAFEWSGGGVWHLTNSIFHCVGGSGGDVRMIHAKLQAMRDATEDMVENGAAEQGARSISSWVVSVLASIFAINLGLDAGRWTVGN